MAKKTGKRASKKVRKVKRVKAVSRKAGKVKRASRKVVKKRVKAKAVRKAKPVRKLVKPTAKKEQKKVLVGNVTHFYTEIEVGIVELVRTLNVGDKILIQGTTTNFKQKVESMQINRKPVSVANKGDVIGLKVKGRVREKDKVYFVG